MSREQNPRIAAESSLDRERDLVAGDLEVAGDIEVDCTLEPGTEPTRPINVQPRIESELVGAGLIEPGLIEPPALLVRRSSSTLLPPAPEAPVERPVSLSKTGTIPPGSGIGACRTNLNRYPSAPPSIRPSVATVPPLARRRDEGSLLSQVFWGALAIAFGASAGAVYWELTEAPQHPHGAFASGTAQRKTFANMPPMERRRSDRVSEWLPVQLDAGKAGLTGQAANPGQAAKAGLAVTHNVSETGALLVTAQVLEVGQVVRIAASLPASEESLARDISVEARVVRFSPNAEDPEGLWPYSVAVQFTTPQPELEAALRDQFDH